MPSLLFTSSVSRKSKIFMLALPVLLLSACGDLWEPVAYSGFPYNNERTAGHGIAYVLENMLPERGAILDTVQSDSDIVIDPKALMRDPAEEITEPVHHEGHSGSMDGEDVLKALDKAFNQMQRK